MLRRVPCQQCQRRGPAIHRCGAAPGTSSRCCCPPQRRKNPPASETCHDLLQGKHDGQGVFTSQLRHLRKIWEEYYLKKKEDQ